MTERETSKSKFIFVLSVQLWNSYYRIFVRKRAINRVRGIVSKISPFSILCFYVQVRISSHFRKRTLDRFVAHRVYECPPQIQVSMQSVHAFDFTFLLRFIRRKVVKRERTFSPRERESRGNNVDDDGNESSFTSISGIVGQVLCPKSRDGCCAMALRASLEGESHFLVFRFQ